MPDWKTLKRFQVLLPLSPPTCTQSGESLTVLGAHVLRPATGSHYSLYMFMGGITGSLPQSLLSSVCLGHLCCSRVSWMLTCAHGRLPEPREHPGRSLMPIPALRRPGPFYFPRLWSSRASLWSQRPEAGRPGPGHGHTHLQTLPRCGISALWKPPCYKQVCCLFLHRLLSALTEHAECRAARGVSGTGGQSQELANGSWVKEAKDGPNPLVWAGGRIRMPSSRWQAANRVPAPRHRACLSLLSGPGPRDSQAASLRTAARPATLPSSCPEMGTVNGAHRIHHPCVGTVGPLRTRCLSRSVSCREHGGAQQAGRHTASCTTILFQSLCNKEHC
ncbi:uncharacterized protein LOC132003128 isoform X2 [Mustela nigripes]|uniref:uncharacterized protein LOC132003128 isoform X2 n=1 Tax=Mustela nigripes TaxID=77151 RepID=UPI002814F057|nr:uncharacterized protein LOC132003128 isoform X2 [Mustela nigripes]